MKIINSPIGRKPPTKKATKPKAKYKAPKTWQDAYIALDKAYLAKPLNADELKELSAFIQAVKKDVGVESNKRYVELHKRSLGGARYYAKPSFNQTSGGNFLEDFLSMYARRYGFAFMKIDVKGTWVEEIQKWIPTKSTSGMVDCIIIANSRTAPIEVKYGKDRLSDAQLKLHAKIEANGVKVWIFKTVEDLHEIHKFLTK